MMGRVVHWKKCNIWQVRVYPISIRNRPLLSASLTVYFTDFSCDLEVACMCPDSRISLVPRRQPWKQDLSITAARELVDDIWASSQAVSPATRSKELMRHENRRDYGLSRRIKRRSCPEQSGLLDPRTHWRTPSVDLRTVGPTPEWIRTRRACSRVEPCGTEPARRFIHKTKIWNSECFHRYREWFCPRALEQEC